MPDVENILNISMCSGKGSKAEKNHDQFKGLEEQFFFFLYKYNVTMFEQTILNIAGAYEEMEKVFRDNIICAIMVSVPTQKRKCAHTHNTNTLNGKSKNIDFPRKITRCKPQVIFSRGTLDFFRNPTYKN